MKASFIPTCSHSLVATAPIFTAVTCRVYYRYDRLHAAWALAARNSSRAAIVSARAAEAALGAA